MTLKFMNCLKDLSIVRFFDNRYLTVEQATFDYIELIKAFKD